MIRDQVDRRAAETAAGQPCPQAARMLPSDLHQKIQFRGAVLKEVSGAFMALKHVLPKLPIILVVQSPLASGTARDLAYDVMSTFVFALCQFRFARGQLTRLERTQTF